MIIKTISLAFAAACLMTASALPAAPAQMAGETQLITNGPQTSPGDVSTPSSARCRGADLPLALIEAGETIGMELCVGDRTALLAHPHLAKGGADF